MNLRRVKVAAAHAAPRVYERFCYCRLAAQGEQIHISCWPAIGPTRKPGPGSSKNFDNLAANRIRAGAHSFEAKAFGVLNAGFMDRAMLDDPLKGADAQAAEVLEGTPRAATQFLDPTGDTIGDTMHQEEGLTYATFDLNGCVEPKQFHDIVGYYNRFDVVQLNIDRRRLAPAYVIDDFAAGVATNNGADVEPRPNNAGTR